MATSEASQPPILAPDDNEGKIELRIPPPPKDWELNDLLIEIANEMTKEQFEEAKARFRGDGGLPRRLLEDIETPMELFDSLQKNLFLGRDNLIYLQAIVYKIGRKDLFERAVEYAQSLGDIIHFSSPPREPANGYRYVQFHIEGTDFRKYTRSSLDATRLTAARLMMVPPEFVIIAGIEPSSSLIITLMIPARFVQYLEAASKKKMVAKELTKLGIDIVRINNTSINLHGVEGADVVETEEQTELKTVYEQLKDTKGKLEDREIECLKLNRRLKAKEMECGSYYQTRAMIDELLNITKFRNTAPTLFEQSALAFFRFCLKKVQQLQYDKDIIDMLLDAQTYVTTIRIKTAKDIYFNALLLENRDLKSQLFNLQVLNTKMEIWNGFDTQEFQRRLNKSLLEFLSGKIVVKQGIEFSPLALQILKELSNKLSASDKLSLVNAYKWPEDDELTTYMKKKDSILLAGLLCKEIQLNGGTAVDFDEFVMRKLTEAKRPDLHELFLQMKRSSTDTPRPASKGINRPQQVRSSKYPAKSGKHRRNNKSTTPPPPAPTKSLQQQVEVLLCKVENIEGMIKEARTYKSTLGADIFQTNPLSQGIKTDQRNLFGIYGTPSNVNLKTS